MVEWTGSSLVFIVCINSCLWASYNRISLLIHYSSMKYADSKWMIWSCLLMYPIVVHISRLNMKYEIWKNVEDLKKFSLHFFPDNLLDRPEGHTNDLYKICFGYSALFLLSKLLPDLPNFVQKLSDLFLGFKSIDLKP